MVRIIVIVLVILSVHGFSQNVGIGTTNPLSKLHVAGAIRSDTLIYVGPGVRSLFAAPNGRIYDSLVLPSTLNWEVNGNSNITPARFLGTTNANDVIFKTNNIERARIMSNGNIGINTPAPSVLFTNSAFHSGDQSGLGTQVAMGLDWNANDLGYVASFYNSGTTAGSSGALIKINDVTAGSKALTVNAGVIGSGTDLLTVLGNGNTGVGTNAPANRFEIKSATANTSGLRFTNLTAASTTVATNGKALSVDANGDVVLVSSASNAWDLLGNAGTSPATNFLGTTDGQPLVFKTNNTEAVRVLTNGNVGIGTTTPAARLDVGEAVTPNVVKSILARLPEGNTTGVGTYLGVKAYDTQPISINSFAIEHRFYGSLNGSINFYRGGTNGDGFMTFATNNGTERMRITFGGNVGIGAIAPGNKLEITSATANTSGLRFTNLTAASTTVASNGKALSVDANGDVVLVSSASNAWLLNGNAGTTPGTNFLGTTDAQDLVIRTNNTEKVRVLSNGQVGIGTNAPSASAIVQIVSTTQGVMFPSMTSTQRLAIVAPAAGLLVYDVTANILMSYNGTRWQEVGGDPIGSIEAFHKSMAGTPVLPWGWVECNGQVIADAESPYNGQAVPLLNSNGKFLRGSTTSGTMQTEDVGTHTHAGSTSAAGGHNHGGSTGSVNSTNGRIVPWDDNLATNKMDGTDTGRLINTPAGGGGAPWDGLATVGNFITTIDQLDHTHVINAEGNHTHVFTTNANTGTETRPTNMSVVWIIRIK